MQFNVHSRLEGSHALLSPSNYHWINYTPEKLEDWFETRMDAVLGSRKHAFACEAITMGIKLPEGPKTLNAYVNDCIGFRMKPEQVLFYSYNAFGTADAIKFDEEQMKLMIFDLKTGVSKASVHQLEVYAALFLLEYGRDLGIKPGDIEYEFRIYQNDDVEIFEGDPADIVNIMSTIIRYDAMIERLKEGVPQ